MDRRMMLMAAGMMHSFSGEPFDRIWDKLNKILDEPLKRTAKSAGRQASPRMSNDEIRAALKTMNEDLKR